MCSMCSLESPRPAECRFMIILQCTRMSIQKLFGEMVPRLQANHGTRLKQFEVWESILASKLAETEFVISIASPIFINSALRRSLGTEYKNQLFRYLIDKDLACAIGPETIIYYKLPISEWANRLYAWVQQWGKCNCVESVHSLISGKDAFCEMPKELVLKILVHLASSKRCEIIFEGDIPHGVKFFS